MLKKKQTLFNNNHESFKFNPTDSVDNKLSKNKSKKINDEEVFFY